MGIHRDIVSKYWERPVPESLPSNTPPEWTTTIDWEYVKKEIENGISAKTLYKEFFHSQVLPAYPNFVRYFRLNIKSEKPLIFRKRITCVENRK